MCLTAADTERHRVHRNISGNRPRILVAHPSAELYGSDRVLLETLEGLQAEGAEVVLALPVRGPLVDEAERRGATVTICPSPVLRKSFLNPRGLMVLAGQCLAGMVSAGRLLGRVKPDVVYVNTITIPLWTVMAFVARRPSIIHIHEAEGNAPAAIRKVLALPLLLGTELVTNSEFSRTVLASSFPRLAARTEIITNGVPGPDSIRPARERLDDVLRIGYVGRLSHRKGVDLLLEAAGLLQGRGRQVQVTLIGSVYPGNEPYEEALRERAEQADLAGRVTFLGFLPSVWASLSEADVVVIPSRADEPFGNTAVEAVLAQRPSVVSRTSGLIEASEGFRSTLQITPDSADAIALALEHIAENWSEFRDAAVDDAATASRRNGIGEYRRRIAAAVLQLAAGRTRA